MSREVGRGDATAIGALGWWFELREPRYSSVSCWLSNVDMNTCGAMCSCASLVSEKYFWTAAL